MPYTRPFAARDLTEQVLTEGIDTVSQENQSTSGVVEERESTPETNATTDCPFYEITDRTESVHQLDDGGRSVPTVTPATSDNWAWALIVLQMFSDDIWAPGRGQVCIERETREVNGSTA